MKYRRLGSTELKVSVVGVGTWQFGGEWGRFYSQAEADALLDQAADVGINLIDTAECYGDHLSERLIGGYLKARRREDWILATKFGHHYNGHLDRTEEYQPAQIVRQLEDSLKALRTDYIDLYQFHSGGNEFFDRDEIWQTLERVVREGKVRHLGTSIGWNDNLHQTAASTARGVRALQVVYNRLDRKPEVEVLPSCQAQDLGVLARVPLASGFLSGKYKVGAEFPRGDVRSREEKTAWDETIRQVEEIRVNEVPEGVDMAAWALAWCLRHPAVTTVIPGCKDAAQVVLNASAAELVESGHRLEWADFEKKPFPS